MTKAHRKHCPQMLAKKTQPKTMIFLRNKDLPKIPPSSEIKNFDQGNPINKKNNHGATGHESFREYEFQLCHTLIKRSDDRTSMDPFALITGDRHQHGLNHQHYQKNTLFNSKYHKKFRQKPALDRHNNGDPTERPSTTNVSNENPTEKKTCLKKIVSLNKIVSEILPKTPYKFPGGQNHVLDFIYQMILLGRTMGCFNIFI